MIKQLGEGKQHIRINFNKFFEAEEDDFLSFSCGTLRNAPQLEHTHTNNIFIQIATAFLFLL
jgi:hypothetical protein